MHTTTPPQITRHIRQLIQKVVPGGVASYMAVQPEVDALEKECFPNVEAKIARAGGRMLRGWQLWEWAHVLVEAEFHAVWLSPDGQMVDLTPKPHHETTVLFVPDARRSYSGATVDNVRLPIRDDQLIRHFIGVSEAITRVLSRGVPAAPGEVSVPAHEIEPLQQAHQFLGYALLSGLRGHQPCQCGSGSKYKRCHGRQLERAFSL
ncbi:MAG TPA: SEC-C domain-containing protein [Luteimonas sp.]|nr:SEC-C domain-containing protein [Luteimonas sp.]